MIEHRPFETLGRIERDWLTTGLHFRFGEIGPPEHAPVGALYVWNDDEFAPHSGFGMHPHRNVEIVTYVCSGAITHEDDFGNRSRLDAGDVQVMSAGTGVFHSERNEEPVPTRLFQIWLTPRRRDGEPRWATRQFPREQREAQLLPLASGDAADVRDGALEINADARLLHAAMLAGQTLEYALPAGGQAYLVAATGRLDVASVRLAARDGAAIMGEDRVSVSAIDRTSVFLLELLSEFPQSE